MKNFTCPCFVRVGQNKERKELVDWLYSIGYNIHKSLKYWPNMAWIVCKDNTVYNDPDEVYKTYDCNTDIGLFKALVAMNDTDDYMQWFIDRVGGDDEYDEKGDYGWYLCKDKQLRCAVDCYSKATKEEIIKHFMIKN